MDARRISSGVAGPFLRGLDALDGVLRPNLPRTRHPRLVAEIGIPRASRCAWPLLAHAGALSRPSLERRGIGPRLGRKPAAGESLPRRAGGRLHAARAAALVRESGQAHRQIPQGVPARQRHTALPARLRRHRRTAPAPPLRCQLGRLRPGTDAVGPRPAPSLLLRHAARCGARLAAAAPRPALRFRVQVYRRPAHDEVHAHRERRPRVGTPLGGLSRRPRLRPSPTTSAPCRSSRSGRSG